MERPEKKKQTALLPPLNKRVIVQCQKASCLAYLDTDGRWKSAHTRKQLLDVIDSSPVGEW